MSWTNLPTDYADAVWEGERKYTINLGGGGTYQNSTITDETPYTPSEVGGNYFYGANDANQTNDAINKIVAACGGDVDNLEVLKPFVLFNNASGTQSTITLSQTVDNFDCLGIFYRDNSNYCGIAKIYQPDGKSTLLSTILTASSGTRCWLKSTKVAISGNTITFELDRGQTTIINGALPEIATNNNIWIYCVVGYKY